MREDPSELTARVGTAGRAREESGVDVFAVRDGVVADYREFVQGFLRVRDKRIAGHVERAIAGGLLWPEPWLSLNPAFESGGDVEQLVAMGLLHPACSEIFRIEGRTLRLHRHQREAIEAARLRLAESLLVVEDVSTGRALPRSFASLTDSAKSHYLRTARQLVDMYHASLEGYVPLSDAEILMLKRLRERHQLSPAQRLAHDGIVGQLRRTLQRALDGQEASHDHLG